MILKLIKILLLALLPLSLSAKTIIENAEDGTVSKWRVVIGDSKDIVNIYDSEIKSRVIELNGGGSYKMGATGGDRAFNITKDKTISWDMKTDVAYTIYIIANTTEGLRYIFYVSTPSRGLKHGLPNGVHHGLGKATIDGRWRRITRDLETDLQDAEPTNKLLSINGFIYNGGDGGRLDNITLYTPKEIVYQDREVEVKNKYELTINNSDFKILQWKFKDFGGEPEILDERGTIRDINAFEFRVNVDTVNGERDLIYTLGEKNLGLVEGGKTIHHGLGDDRAIGSVWAGDDPINELGLWQSITRDLDEDIRDFEPNNRLLKVNLFKVTNSGKVKEIKMLSSVDTNFSKKEESSNIDINSSSSNSNIHISIPKDSSDSVGGVEIFYSFLLLYISLITYFLFRKEYINL